MSTADPAGEPGVVPDERTGPRLPPDRLLLDHQGAKALRRGVDGSSQAGRPGAHDHDVVQGLGRRRGHQAEGVGDLDVGGVDQRRGRRGELQDEHGQLGVLQAQALEHAPARRGVGGVVADGDVVPAEGVAQGVGALVGTPDEAHRLEPGPLREVPVIEEVGDGAVELFVPAALGPEDLGLGVTVGDGPEHGRGTVEVTPGHDDDPLGRGMDGSGPPEEVEAVTVDLVEAGEHHGDVPTPAPEPVEDRPGVLVAPTRGDLVVAAVAAAQLVVEGLPRLVVERGQQHDGQPVVGHLGPLGVQVVGPSRG